MRKLYIYINTHIYTGLDIVVNYGDSAHVWVRLLVSTFTKIDLILISLAFFFLKKLKRLK